ncbi:hypothetical protein IP88_15515 [alpha proteobacterium AAP81b]|nr:hypothetical protein IP88_15515 [alpha proteobacterium AAP81b]
MRIALLLLTLLMSAAPAAAEPVPIAVAPDATWRHGRSGVAIPPTLAGLSRSEIKDLSSDQSDVAAAFGAPGGGIATLYIYRPGTGDVPLWFDMARRAIEQRPEWNAAAASPRAVAAVGEARDGLGIVYAAADGRRRATALALAPAGPWIVKLRVTADNADPAAVEATLLAALRGLGWPAERVARSEAMPVAACATPLTFRTARLRRANSANSLGELLVGLTIAGIAGKDEKPKADEKPVVWCRDAATDAAVFRADGASDGYLLAVNDAGSAVLVDNSASKLMGSGRDWGVSLYQQGSVYAFRGFTGLPSPAQALAQVQTDTPTGSQRQDGAGDTTITLPPK